jgi:hypothetical protein
MIWPYLVKIGPVHGSGEEVENVKVYMQTDGRNDGRRTTGDQKSSLELSAQVSLKYVYKMYL